MLHYIFRLDKRSLHDKIVIPKQGQAEKNKGI